MASHNHARRTVTHEKIAERKIEIARIKAEAEEKRQIKIYEKSAFFRNKPGKILWGFSLFVSLFCIVFIVDGWLGKKYSELEIKSSSEDIVYLTTGGYLVASTFNWAYLDDKEQFGIHMHHDEFNKINEVGVIELGSSPIFNVPSDFKVKNILGIYEHSKFDKDYNFQFFIPFFLLILSAIWLFSKPQESFQWIMFGYFNMVVIPIVLLLLVIKIIGYINGIGMYEIDVSSLNI